MTARLLVLLASFGGIGSIVLMGRALVTRSAARPVEVSGVALEHNEPAFVVFTSPTCAPCRKAVAAARAAAGDEAQVLTVDAIERSDVALRNRVRAVPTVLLVEPGGRVIERWQKPPAPTALRAALGATSRR